MPFVGAGGHRLEYEWIGAPPSGGSALVFLHQGLGAAGTWGPFPAALARTAGLPALVYSRWGHGASDALDGPRGNGFMHDEALVTLPELLVRFELRQPILVGHSDGASIALIYAGAAPRAVRALVLEAPHVFSDPVTVGAVEATVDRYERGDLAARLARHHGPNTDTMFRGWSRAWLDPAMSDWNIGAYVRRVACPALVIQGEDDEYGTLEQVACIGRQAAGPVETLVLPRCGHEPHREYPDEVLRRIGAFLERLPDGSRRP
jgi:pimeloyl-ACP methyl ester carboxylesterase